MDRRTFLGGVALGFLGAPPVTETQHRPPGPKVPRVGYLGGAPSSLFYESFLQGLRELGYVVGQNVSVESRWYDEGDPTRARALAVELAMAKVDVLVAIGPLGAMQAKAVSDRVPVVFVHATDPTRTQLVASLARPGGNMTGLVFDPTPGIVSKVVQLLKELDPRLSRLALLWNPNSPNLVRYLKAAEQAARALAVSAHRVPIREAKEIDLAFASIAAAGDDGVVVLAEVVTVVNCREIVRLASAHHLALASYVRQFPDAGGLMAYGPSLRDMVKRAAWFVDKILKGAKPADLPIEQPTKFELVINLRTAKALGLTIPPSLLQRADEVIE